MSGRIGRTYKDFVRPLYYVGQHEQDRSGMRESTTASLSGPIDQSTSIMVASAPSYPILNTLVPQPAPQPLQPTLIVPEPPGHAGMSPEGSERDIQNFDCDRGTWQYECATLEHPYPIHPLTNNNYNDELSPPANSNASIFLLQDDLLPIAHQPAFDVPGFDMHFVPDLSLPSSEYYTSTITGWKDPKLEPAIYQRMRDRYRRALPVSAGVYVADYDVTNKEANGKPMSDTALARVLQISEKWDPKGLFPNYQKFIAARDKINKLMIKPQL
ncbi:hypothetical protein BJX99DRAFT_255282 [Aspergillus californicus]